MDYLILGILAHVDAGKTTLCERLLLQNGVTSSFGRVDKGESFLDYDKLERKRGITIFSQEAIISDGQCEITLLDTPGHVDFVWETLAVFNILDCALLVVDASSRLSVHTKRLFSLLKKNNIPTIIFLNKMDLVEKSEDEVFAEFSVLDESLVSFCDDKYEMEENIAMRGSEQMLDTFLLNGGLEVDDIRDTIAKGDVTPVYFGEALSGEGIEKLNQGIFGYIKKRSFDEVGFLPYKILRDEKNNRFVCGRVLCEELKVKGFLGEEKIEEIRRYNGHKLEQIQSAPYGMVVAIRGPKEIKPRIKGFGAFLPLMEYEVLLPEGIDRLGVIKSFAPIEEEMPSLNLRYDSKTDRILISPMGEVQLEILRDIFLDRFGVEVEFASAGVIYKETISGPIEGIGHFEPLRHYAECHLYLEPNPGKGIEVESRLATDQLSANWQRQILQWAKNLPHIGTSIGEELVDVKITLVAGRSHEKHTEGGDFREATIRAIRHALMKAGTDILEPLYSFEILSQGDLVGKILTRLETMGADFAPPIYEGEIASIQGTFPAIKLEDFPIYLSSISRGECELSLGFGGYTKVENATDIIERAGYEPEADLENPADSVFTKGGASVIVPWYQVEEYMHVPLAVTQKKEVKKDTNVSIKSPLGEMSIGTEEIDRIIGAAGGLNKKENPTNRRSHWNRYQKNEEMFVANDMTKVKKKSTDYSNQEEYLLVDGYNIIFAWETLKSLSNDNIDSARDYLVDVLSEYAVYTGRNVILVFDAYRISGGVGSVSKIKGIDVIYTKEAETADAYIEKTSRKLSDGNRVWVATSDRLEQMIVWGDGAIPISALDFQKEIEDMKAEIRNNI